MDVQGFELDVLRGDEHLLRNQKIKFIYCEVEFLEIYKGQTLDEDVIKYLRAFDYVPVYLYNINYSNENIAWCDVLFEKN